MVKNKVLYTAFLSIVTFIFIGILLYIIYCFGFYDNQIKEKYVQIYNEKRFDELYDILEESDALTKNDFEVVTTLMYDQTKLEEIYSKYYENSTLWEDKISFISTYYYGENKIYEDDITYQNKGKTSLFKRASYKIKNINIKSKNNKC